MSEQDERARKIAELEAARRRIEAELRALQSAPPTTAPTEGTVEVSGEVNGPVAGVNKGTMQASYGAPLITTGGGDYAEGDIDKRQGTFYAAQVQTFFLAADTPDPSVEQRTLLVSYLDGLVTRCERLRITGMVERERTQGKAPRVTLSQVYVALAATTWQTVEEADTPDALRDALAAGDADTVLPWDARRLVEPRQMEGIGWAAGREDAARYRLERPVLVTEALSRQRQIVLLGGPGSGKSTFLRHLAMMLARAETQGQALPQLPGWEAGLVLPLVASLGAYAAWAVAHDDLSTEGLWRFLLASCEGVLLDGLAAQIKAAFRARRLVLLLDGLDEVADLALRAQVAAVVARLGETPGLVVVTCRVRSFTGAVAAPFAAWGEAVHVAPFTLGQVRHFVHAWYQRGVAAQEITPAQATERADELCARIAAHATLRELAETPLLLTIMVILHYYAGKLPNDRADLYEDMTQLLLTRWTAQRREADAAPSLLDQLRTLEPRLSGLHDYQVRSVLEALAYRAHQSARTPDGRGLLDKGVVREAFLRLFGDFGLDDGAAGRCAGLVLRHLEEESGLLLHEGGDLYGLSHLTYEEYLTACHLVKQKGKADFGTLAYEHWRTDAGRWREVIFLALGRMVRGDDREIAARWFDFLLLAAHGERVRDAQERQEAALFAGDCLREIGGQAAVRDTTSVDLGQLWARLAQGLTEGVEGQRLPAGERVRAGVHLGVVGDPRPGVCDVTCMPFVRFDAASFVIGSTPAEADAAGRAWERYYLDQGDEETAKRARRWPEDEINDQPMALSAFALARYPVTNAQYQCFIDAGGYDPRQPWWDEAARAWLARDDATAEGLERWQQRKQKDQPEFWMHERFGKALPNHPVVGVSWYEATAFARWLTLHLHDGFCYRLPSEVEWEYAARGAARRAYAWGHEEPDAERANFDQIYKGTSAVGCFPAGATPEGLLDMSGNVWEWTRSARRSYPYDPDDGREANEDAVNKYFALRGGGWLNPSLHMRASSRDKLWSDAHFNRLGFRLARYAPE